MPAVPTRRDFIRYLALASGAATHTAVAQAALAGDSAALGFTALPHGVDDTHHLPPGYRGEVLLRWGDVVSGLDSSWTPPLERAAEQQRRFGYNNDFIAYMPLPRGSRNSDHGLLCVNHEYTNTAFMWPGLNPLAPGSAMTRARTAVEIAAIGHAVVEIKRRAAGWESSGRQYNRRITGASPVLLSGPAAGHARLRTREDDSGRQCLGILNPCSGGKTPWGTVLIAEENFNVLFHGRSDDQRERRNHARYGVGRSRAYSWWAKHFPRFDIGHEPREANRFGWVVELDPYDPTAAPVKRTALGRFKHEAATCALDADGRVVVYSGDDEAFEYLYRFVSRAAREPLSEQPDRDLLDDGDLYVARFYDDGRLHWQRLRHGDGPLTAANGFHDQADVLIETRRAADLLGATRLDRPEDVETNPSDGTVYALLTNNSRRHADALDAANPRSHNRYGHILRLLPPGAPGLKVAHAADEFRWETFVLAGDPADPDAHARYPGATGDSGWFANPDNCAFDAAGRIWIATDQGRNWRKTGFADGLWAGTRSADGRFEFRRFFRAPIGAEVCGPEFTPDNRTLFIAVQHPAVDGLRGGYDNPATRWPDFIEGLPPRPAVIAVTRDDDGVIGS